MGQIKITPQELRDLASALTRNASEVSQLASTLKNNVNNRTANWEGKSKTRYINDFNAIYPTLATKLPQLLEAMAKDLRDTATRFEQFDQ